MIGFLFLKLKVPGGMMVGALLAVSILSVCTDFAYMPSYTRVAAQITAGTFYCLYCREKGFETPSSYRQTVGNFAGRHAVPEFDHGDL